jgi:hypothetical protein
LPQKNDQKPSESYESFSASVDSGKHEFQATLFKLENAVLVFFYSAKTMKLGTLALALPQFAGKSYLSSILLGDRNHVITKILAGRIAQKYSEIALVSTHLPEIQEANVSSILFKLAEKLLDTARQERHG